jgi:hypothetical protein
MTEADLDSIERALGFPLPAFYRWFTVDVIGWEEQFGERAGRFVILPTGSVVYRHPEDSREWFAGGTAKQFREAARAWNLYQDAVVGLPESKQLATVDQLRRDLERMGVLTEQPDALWPVLLEQAEAGLL